MHTSETSYRRTSRRKFPSSRGDVATQSTRKLSAFDTSAKQFLICCASSKCLHFSTCACLKSVLKTCQHCAPQCCASRSSGCLTETGGPSHGPLSHRIPQPHTLPPTWRSRQHTRQTPFRPNEASRKPTTRISAKPIMSRACPGNLAATTRARENDAKRKVLGRLWSLMPMKACSHLLPSTTKRRKFCTRLAGTRHDANAAAGHIHPKLPIRSAAIPPQAWSSLLFQAQYLCV